MGIEPLRVAVIGRTGRGDYGHAIDELFTGLPAAEVVAAADDDAGGWPRRPAARPGRRRRFRRLAEDARRREAADVVAICMRHVDCHAEMAIAAAEAGARGILMEKPFRADARPRPTP